MDLPIRHDLFVTGGVDGFRERPLELLWHSLLDCLWDDAVLGVGGMTLGRASVVDGVWDGVLNTLGKLLLGLAGDDGVALGVGATLTVFVLHLGRGGLDSSLGKKFSRLR